ncbi:MAG: glycosyltransferase family 2 protein [Verrucomicrobiota bacterium]
MVAETVECRIPAYRRPELLRRALRALQAQTWENWQAIVLDDSPGDEAAEVVRECRDARITHRKNPRQLGAAGNLDQAFRAAPLLGGRYAFVLEDDNAIDPGFITTGVERLARGDISVLSFNQRAVRFDSAGNTEPVGVLRPDQTAEMTWPPDRLWVNAFLGVSLPNGGYFWRLDRGVDLAVGPDVREPQLQECVRQTRVPAVVLLPQPFTVWSHLPPAGVRRQVVGHRRFAVSLNALSKRILAQMGEARLLEAARRDGDPGILRRVEQCLDELSLLPPRQWRRFPGAPVKALRFWLRGRLYPDSTRLDRVTYPAA